MKKYIILIASQLLIINIIIATPQSDLEKAKKCILGNFGVEYPKRTCKLLQKFKDYSSSSNNEPLICNRILFYGPTGNGKAFLANHFAQEANAELIFLSGPTIVGPYAGQGSHTIIEVFQKAQEIAQYKKVVIFINKVDAIGIIKESETNSQLKNALLTLCCCLDNCKNNPNILVICTTNDFGNLSRKLKDRFGNNRILISNPNQDVRKTFIEKHLENKHISIAPNLLNTYAKETNNLGIRSIENTLDDLIEKIEDNHIDLTITNIKRIVQEQKNRLKEAKQGDSEKIQLIKIHVFSTLTTILLKILLS